MGSPAIYPDNPLTRMIERASQRGVERREVPVDAGTSPAARSAAIGREVELPPLSPEERAELDAKAAELGILPEGQEDNPYSSMSAALAAGASVEGPATPSPVVERTHIQAIHKVVEPALVRLPDFTKIGGIDLIRGVVYLDGMEFAIPKGDCDQFRLYTVRIAHAAITAKLVEAEKLLNAAVTGAVTGEDTDGGSATEEVQSVQKPAESE